MGKVIREVVDVKLEHITTNEGLKLIRRTTTIRMPNGRFRRPVDYYDATPGTRRITAEERERLRIPVYPYLI